MRYLVMETHTSYAVVLDEEGKFHTAANLGYNIGQTLERVELLGNYPAQKKRTGMRRGIVAAVAVAACLLVFIGYNLLKAPDVYGSVIMSINPQLRIGLDKAGEVVEIQGLNNDGKSLAAGLDLKGSPAGDAVARITDKAIDTGYLQDGGEVLLEIQTDDKGWYAEVESPMRDGAAHAIEGKVDAQLTVVQISEEAPPLSTPDVQPSESAIPTTAAQTSAPVATAEPEQTTIPPTTSQPEQVSPSQEVEETPSPTTVRTPMPLQTQRPVQTATPAPTPRPAPTPTQPSRTATVRETPRPTVTVAPPPTATPRPTVVLTPEPTQAQTAPPPQTSKPVTSIDVNNPEPSTGTGEETTGIHDFALTMANAVIDLIRV